MNPPTSSIELARLPVCKMEDVLLARFVGRNEASKMGFPPAHLTRIATVISEMTRNVVQHAGSPGEFVLYRVAEDHRAGLRMVISDQGKGMPASWQGGGPAAHSGAGIPGSRKLVDHFQIQSSPGGGTTVEMILWKSEEP